MKESDEEVRFRQSFESEPEPRESRGRLIFLVFLALLAAGLLGLIVYGHYHATQQKAPALSRPAKTTKFMADVRREMIAANARAETDEGRAKCKEDQGEYASGICYAPELLHDDEALRKFVTDDHYKAMLPVSTKAECEALGRYWFAPPFPPNYPPMCVDSGVAQKYQLDALPKQ